MLHSLSLHPSLTTLPLRLTLHPLTFKKLPVLTELPFLTMLPLPTRHSLLSRHFLSRPLILSRHFLPSHLLCSFRAPSASFVATLGPGRHLLFLRQELQSLHSLCQESIKAWKPRPFGFIRLRFNTTKKGSSPSLFSFYFIYLSLWKGQVMYGPENIYLQMAFLAHLRISISKLAF